MAFTQTATRSYMMRGTANSGDMNARSFHFARGAITSIRVGTANWYVPEGHTSVETGSGGSLVVSGSIEYPSGTFTQLRFGGAATGTVANGQSLISDALSISIPDGAKFWIRRYLNGAWNVYTMVDSGVVGSVAEGDVMMYGGGDLSMGGTLTDNSGMFNFPICILGDNCPSSSLAIIGDSRGCGYNDKTPGTAGDIGMIARPIGNQIGYICLSCDGDLTHQFMLSHTQRLAMAQWCTHALIQYGINDIEDRGLATTQADIASLISLLSPQPTFGATLPPRTTGAWTQISGSDQTLSAYSANIASYNTWIRAGVSGLVGYLELADQLEIATRTGKWLADGTVGHYSADGLHGTTAAYQHLVVDAAVFVTEQIGGTMSVTATLTAAASTAFNTFAHADGVAYESVAATTYIGSQTISPAYPTMPDVAWIDRYALFCVVHSKPSAANSGTLTPPSGWTQVASLTGAGGYGTTLAADTGNTNLWLLRKDTLTGSETGTQAIVLTLNNSASATMFLVSKATSAGTWSVASATGSDITAGAVSITFDGDPGFAANDLAVVAFGIPTDVTTPAQFSAEALTATGATFATGAEIRETDSGTNNDIGGLLWRTNCTAGTSSAAAVFAATAGGTTTNVRGPAILLRVREVAGGAQYTVTCTSTSTTSTAQSQGLLHHTKLIPSVAATTSTDANVTIRGTRRIDVASTATATTPTDVTLRKSRRMIPVGANTSSSWVSQSLLHSGILGSASTATGSTWATVNVSVLIRYMLTATATGTASSAQNQSILHTCKLTTAATATASNWATQTILHHGKLQPGATANASTATQVIILHTAKLGALSASTSSPASAQSIRHHARLSATAGSSSSAWATVTISHTVVTAYALTALSRSTASTWADQSIKANRKVFSASTASQSAWLSADLRYSTPTTFTVIAVATATSSTAQSVTILHAAKLGATSTETTSDAPAVGLRHAARLAADSTATASSWQSAQVLANHRLGVSTFATASPASAAELIWSAFGEYRLNTTAVGTASEFATVGLLARHRISATSTTTASVASTAQVSVGWHIVTQSAPTATVWQQQGVWHNSRILATTSTTATAWRSAVLDYSAFTTVTGGAILVSLGGNRALALDLVSPGTIQLELTS